jgi:hypothetical protein
MMSVDIVDSTFTEAKVVKQVRYPTGYNLFCTHTREQGICQKRWRAMDVSEREMWNTKAAVIKDAMINGVPIPLYVLPRKSKNNDEAQMLACEGEVWRVMSWWRKTEKTKPVILNKMPKGMCAIKKQRPCTRV